MRYSLYVALIAVLALLLPAQQAMACSIARPEPQNYIDQAPVIAIGKLANADEGIITLKVDEYLKGAQESQELVLNNHQFDIGASCDESLGPGDRLSDGQQVLVFLEPDTSNVGADWRPSGIGGFGVFVVSDGQVKLAGNEQQPDSFGTLEEVKARIVEQVGAAPEGEEVIEPQTGDTPEETEGAEEATASPTLPRILLIVLLTITTLLAGWIGATMLKRRRAG